MRALLLLSLVGIAIYALLVLTSNVVPNGRVEDTFAGKTQPNHPIDRELRSWGANLPALVNSQQPQPQQNVAHAPTDECRTLTNLLPLLATSRPRNWTAQSRTTLNGLR